MGEDGTVFLDCHSRVKNGLAGLWAFRLKACLALWSKRLAGAVACRRWPEQPAKYNEFDVLQGRIPADDRATAS